MKKTLIMLSFVFALIFALAIFNTSAATQEGTPVSTAAEFEAMVSGGTYYLTNDIDLGGKDYENGIFGRRIDSNGDGTPDTAVGFSVTLYGNGYTVGNFVLGDVEGYHVGMFNEVMTGQYLNIYDLNFGSATLPVSVTRAKTASSAYAVIAGHIADNSVVYLKNVNVTANFKITTNTKGMYGMFTGKTRCAIFENCTSNGTMELGDGAAHSNYMNAAGFCGSIETDVSFFNCTNNTNITIKGTKNEGRIGGFIGYGGNAGYAYLENCVNNGNLTVLDGTDYESDSYIGGFVADITKNVVFINCKNNGTLTCTKADRKGELAARVKATFIAVASSHNDSIVDCPSVGTSRPAIIVDKLGVDEVATGSQAIGSKEDFLKMQSGGVYHLTADIDLGGQVFTDYIFKEFSGVLNGCGHKIFNYTITGTTSTANDVGTFAKIGEKSAVVIANLHIGAPNNLVKVIDLSDSSPEVAQSKSAFIGFIDASSQAYIKNVDVYAEVKANTLDKINLGGFIGGARFVVINECTFNGSVTNVTGPNHVASGGNYANIAAFGGAISNHGVFYLNCVNNGDITVGALDGSESVRASGFFGYADSKRITMIGCVNNGNITTLNATLEGGAVTDGGFAAGFGSWVKGSLIMIDCVNNGTITGKDAVGGIIGNASGNVFMIGVENKGTVATDATSSGNIVGAGAEKVFALALPKVETPVEPETPVVPTPPTSDMSIVYVAVISMIALAGASIIVYRKRNCLSK